MNPGAIALVFFPFSHTEPEPFKKRPVLVLTSSRAAADEALLVAMVTSNARRVRSPKQGDILIKEWNAAGLLQPSVVRARRLWTAERRDFAQVLGTVESETLEAVKEHVRLLLA